MKGRKEEACLHHWCAMAAKKPQYWACFKTDFIMNQPALQSFKLSNMLISDKPYILPVNPYGPDDEQNRNKFEIFRQAMHTHTECIGYWPSDRNTFDKSEVEFVMIEIVEQVPESGCWNEGSPLIDRPDLKEVAIYIGEGSTSHQLVELDNYTVVYDINPTDITIEKAEVIEYAKVAGIPMLTSRQLSPAAMILEGKDENTTPERRAQILDAFKRGYKVMQNLNVPAYRILFVQYDHTHKIEILFD